MSEEDLSNRISVRRLALYLYPLGIGAVGINLFFLSLIFSWVGWPVMSPYLAMAGGVVLGYPFAYPFAKHIRYLMDKSDGLLD
ncbi:hypothetical protein PsW64_01395 [Pseudovibrio sp. W64]|jgi:hypothetical protein|uniref:NnrT protein n=1 Tax=Pseudovibrio ascidiaceicola TaxID=285279 RepID=A0A1I3Y3I2_9HYPH|nr:MULTISPECIES: hypothetical protein [Pseudovibrio]KZK77259.1 hypothetical protein PsAD46_05088 [Pseudovibrio sp. Ad46]KZK86736.1 hypothetical protein PsW64_01395 [Pseudovibrio sp. W64]KZK89753.1 hypothetical protein PsAD5_05040 [Pseudovibrio sp. Ad5]KZL03042.1 hypothetical protein PsW74_00871 [Pseudovibrio sp. W74]KZL04939.1 hypothetical protein PsAD14_05179 [Pseudovibrio sp. Ad14]